MDDNEHDEEVLLKWWIDLQAWNWAIVSGFIFMALSAVLAFGFNIEPTLPVILAVGAASMIIAAVYRYLRVRSGGALA